VKKRSFNPDVDVRPWKGGHSPYDILKEGTIAVLVILVLTLTLAAVFGSPDEHAVTLQNWSKADPVDFATTAFTELNGTSETATYGQPYNSQSGYVQNIGPLHLQKWVGVHLAINTTQDFVIGPLESQVNQPNLTTALQQWRSASAQQRTQWMNSYANADAKMTYVSGSVVVPTTNAGPVSEFVNELTTMARSGALDQALLGEKTYYTTNLTKPLMFLADGGWFASLADKQHLTGDQWGMMNETGSYPGQAWLWLYTFWYQIPPFNTSANADALVWGTMMILSAGLLLVPFIPGIRSIPRKSKVYRLIWREHYQRQEH